jgi:hypothetical protein
MHSLACHQIAMSDSNGSRKQTLRDTLCKAPALSVTPINAISFHQRAMDSNYDY